MYDTDKELEKLKSDNDMFVGQIETLQETMSSQLRNGLGDDIRFTLKNPKKISRYRIIKNKIKNFFNKIVEMS